MLLLRIILMCVKPNQAVSLTLLSGTVPFVTILLTVIVIKFAMLLFNQILMTYEL